MNKSNMYAGVKTYNPINGSCPHSCPYCAIQKSFNRKLLSIIQKYSGELRLNEIELKRNLGKNNTWLVCGVGNDLFADGVQFEWIDRILEHCMKYSQNKYMIQTKNSENMYWYLKLKKFPDNFIFGITLETNNELLMKFSGGNYFYDRVRCLRLINHKNKFITCEPLLQFSLINMINLIKNIEPELVYIGANTFKNIVLPEPTKDEVLKLISELEKFTIVEKKPNLQRLLK